MDHNDILVLDYDKTTEKIEVIANSAPEYFDEEAAINAIYEHKNGTITTAELQNRLDDIFANYEARKTLRINRSMDLIEEMIIPSIDAGFGFYEDFYSITAEDDIEFKSVKGKAEMCIRAGIFPGIELSPDAFLQALNNQQISLECKVQITEKNACIQVVAFSTQVGRCEGQFELSEAEIKSFHDIMMQKTHESSRLAYAIGNKYLHDIARYPEYLITETGPDPYEQPLTISYYKDEDYTERIDQYTIDLKHLEEDIPVGYPLKDGVNTVSEFSATKPLSKNHKAVEKE